MSPVAPRRALVVIDVQNIYFAADGMPIEYPPVSVTLPNITTAMDAARAAGIPVVVVRHLPPDGAPDAEGNAPQWALHPDIARRPADHVVEKRRPSVFTGTDFADWLTTQGIDTLTIAGYMTHNCDASTVYEAAHRGYKVEFLSDATGALPYANAAGQASAADIHRVYCVVFHTGFAAVATTAAWTDAVRQAQALPVDNIPASNRRARSGADAVA